jgi:hypothetical protein
VRARADERAVERLEAVLGGADATAPARPPTADAAAASRASAGFPTALASPGWNAQARGLVASNNLSPIAAARVYALVSMAQYGGVVAAGATSDAATLVAQGDGFGPGGRSRFEAERGAVAGASAQVLSFLFPAAAATLEQRLTSEGEAGPGNVHPAFTRGVAAGRAMGDVMIAWAKTDRFTAPFDPTGKFPPGFARWTPNPAPPGGTAPPIAGPLLGLVQPYFMTSGDQFRPAVGPPMPPAVPNAADPFTIALNEVRTFAAGRTPEQLALSQFWNFGAFTETPPGHWEVIAEGLIADNALGEREATHVLALANAATMDAAIGCWDAKFHFLFFRPWQADPTITTPIGKPNHPSFPSGHSCLSAAAATVLERFFPEHAADLDALVAEAGLSRIIGGLHFRFDVTAGQTLGRAVGANAIAYDEARGLLTAVR